MEEGGGEGWRKGEKGEGRVSRSYLKLETATFIPGSGQVTGAPQHNSAFASRPWTNWICLANVSDHVGFLLQCRTLSKALKNTHRIH